MIQLRTLWTLAAGLLGACLLAAPAAAEEQKPIRALMVTGGCCHDYDMQKHLIAEGIKLRLKVPVEWTIYHFEGKGQRVPLYENADWAKGYDIVVHNECYASERDPEWIEKILKPHREGVPAIVMHCTMHSYGFGRIEPWVEFLGVSSHGHGAHYPFKVETIAKDNPLMKAIGDGWQTPQGELYHIARVTDAATPLAHARRLKNNDGQEMHDVCYWTNQYGKARVFGTTVGHHNETVGDPVFQETMARGFLWAVDRFDESLLQDVKPDVLKTAVEQARRKEFEREKVEKSSAVEKHKQRKREAGIPFSKAEERPTTASSEETGKGNLAALAVDGNLTTRWCASGGASGEWWQVDLGEVQPISSTRIHWESSNGVYQYRILGSTDGEKWDTIVDRSKASETNGVAVDKFEPANVRYLRVEFLGTSSGGWGSIIEFEAYHGPMPPVEDALHATVSTLRLLEGIRAPEEFTVSIFGSPPKVNYPVCLHVTPEGVLFVGVDENGSLGKVDGYGKVLRCVDTDGNGRADDIREFARMRHPRGLHFENNSLWVLHPPFLTRYDDTDGDGVADKSTRLLRGISTEKHVAGRGADHTTNGIRMGIDGWLYIAVGDYGYLKAVDVDGVEHQLLGGGVARVRPDGRELEVYARGLRNICDMAIDPLLNVYTRDNTNDGGGWDIRLSFIPQSSHMGYPSLYQRFADEHVHPLAEYGGGSGTGALYLAEPSLPAPYDNALLTADWGRSHIYYHPLTEDGAGFSAEQQDFLRIPRPTDLDVDATGRIYVGSWNGGGFKYSGESVGYIAVLRPKSGAPGPLPALERLEANDLLDELTHASAVRRQAAQREIVRRGDASLAPGLKQIAGDDGELAVRVAAIFTLKELRGADATPDLVELARHNEIREWALRALTDRITQLDDVPIEPFLAALEDANPRVRAQAAVSLGRLGRVEAAPHLVPLVLDEDPIVSHVAVKALVAVEGIDACLEAIGEEDSPQARGGLRVLREMHHEAAVTGLIGKLDTVKQSSLRHEVLATLARLYYEEGEWTGDWWGTRPDTRGPYYRRGIWSQTERIEALLAKELTAGDAATRQRIAAEIEKHLIESKKLSGASTQLAAAEMTPKVDIAALLAAQADTPGSIGKLDLAEAKKQTLARSGDAALGKQLFTRQGCIQCHTITPGAAPLGPMLLDIGKRYKREELLQSVLEPSAKIAQGFETTNLILLDGRQLLGVVAVEGAEDLTLLDPTGKTHTVVKAEIDERIEMKTSAMPEGLVNGLKPEQLAGLLAYLETLKSDSE